MITQNRKGHLCDYQWTVKAITVWNAMEIKDADSFYETLTELGFSGIPLDRKCKTNSTGTCDCQVILAPIFL